MPIIRRLSTTAAASADRQCRVSAALLSRKENRGSLITEDEMGGGGFDTYGEKRNAYRVFEGKTEEKTLLGRPRGR
jgi:hypothetical protein